MASLNYLTVQDILWINLQVSKRVNHFNFARLEEATFYQYAYGDSNAVAPQAFRFLTGFLKMHPFDVANEPTAFVASLAFLKVNGYLIDLDDSDGSRWASDLSLNGRDDLESRLKSDPHFHPTERPNVRSAIASVLSAYPKSVSLLQKSAA